MRCPLRDLAKGERKLRHVMVGWRFQYVTVFGISKRRAFVPFDFAPTVCCDKLHAGFQCQSGLRFAVERTWSVARARTKRETPGSARGERGREPSGDRGRERQSRNMKIGARSGRRRARRSKCFSIQCRSTLRFASGWSYLYFLS